MLTGPSPASRFNPSDFLSFAQSLSAAKASEAQLRTCVGRAYYAAYLTACDRPRVQAEVQALPRHVRKNLGSHETIIVAVKRIDTAAGHQLDDLRKLRLLADYNLQEGNWPTKWAQSDLLAAHVLPKLSTI